jgi:hypothetical protein
MIRRVVGATCAAALVLSLGASAVFAGEITGTGKTLHVDGGGKWGTGLHARSVCAFSGQEDLQFAAGNGKGIPGHAQSWGQIPKSAPVGEVSRDFLTSIGSAPGIACNPTKGAQEP